MKNEPYFARTHPTYGTLSQNGISQYAEIAARFHAAFLTRDGGFSDMAADALAHRAFDHADSFFAELKKRQSNS